MSLDILEVAGVIGDIGNDTMFDSLIDNPLQVISVTDAAQEAVQPKTRVDVDARGFFHFDVDFEGYWPDGILVNCFLFDVAVIGLLEMIPDIVARRFHAKLKPTVSAIDWHHLLLAVKFHEF